MEVYDTVLRNSEKYSLALRRLFADNGYRRYRMSKFEEYDLYARHKGFLVSDNVITFNDTNGRLLALKPDVTLSIIKNCEDRPETTQRLYYNESVYRVSKGTNSFKEISQSGVECIGKVELQDIADMLLLAARSLSMLSDDWSLNVNLAEEDRQALELIKDKDFRKNIYLRKEPIDPNYYSDTVFKGYIRGIPEALLSGGKYTPLMRKMGRRSQAVGFAVYTDLLDRYGEKQRNEDDYLNVALPKGRLGEQVYRLFAEAGYPCPEILEPGRKLIFENREKKIRFFWVKPTDVASYVERGVADLGVAGSDILNEYHPDVLEQLNLQIGLCRMCVAGPANFTENRDRTLVVATKFPNIATRFFQNKGLDIDIIKLHGSIEIAPLLGLSDVIVDIVETGKTLKENNLKIIEEILPVSARLIANRAIMDFKQDSIAKLTAALKERIKNND